MVNAESIALNPVSLPDFGCPEHAPELSDALYMHRLQLVQDMMRERALDQLVIYGDREHYANFEYLSGFDLRFEEGLLVLGVNGRATYVLGNECEPLAGLSRIKADTKLYQAFSLPNQPIDKLRPLADILKECGIGAGHRVGVIGWKLMAPRYANRDCFDIPQFILDGVRKAAENGEVLNVTDAFIDPVDGIRLINTAEEIAYFEYGATWASIGLLDMLKNLRTGESELDLSRKMRIGAMTENSHPLTVIGENNTFGMVYPGNRKSQLGDRFNCSLGLRGGLNCRTGYIAYGLDDLPEGERDYLDVLVKPYYAAVVNWYENMRIGVKGSDIYNMIERVLPKAKYGWKLNTGHYVANEEWVSSPFDTGSQAVIKSGMCLQMDIIPSVAGYGGVNCEDGIAVADATLRDEIAERFPQVWARIKARRAFMINVLHIQLPDEVLPLCNLAGCYRPYMLNQDLALTVTRPKG